MYTQQNWTSHFKIFRAETQKVKEREREKTEKEINKNIF